MAAVGYAPPEADPAPRESAPDRGVVASLLLHALAAIFVLTFALPGRIPPPVEKSLEVEILTPRQYEAAVNPGAADAPAAVAPAPESGARTPSPMIRATRMLSGAAGTLEARLDLPNVAPTDRKILLCSLEAMEQVHAWRPDFVPERVVPYAMADLTIAADTIRAEGAAFRSKGAWYGLKFDCGLSADRSEVVSFAFQVGDPVPRSEWQARDLPEKY